jgi:hypothetical protein
MRHRRRVSTPFQGRPCLPGSASGPVISPHPWFSSSRGFPFPSEFPFEPLNRTPSRLDSGSTFYVPKSFLCALELFFFSYSVFSMPG